MKECDKNQIKIYLSGDHAGFKLKENIKKDLERKGFEVFDFGPKKYDKNDDYPDFVIPMAKSISKELNSNKNKNQYQNMNIRGFIFAGSGEGEAIAVNKIGGIRAAVYHGKNLKIVKITREHNDSNILCIGARFVKKNEAKKAIDLFLKTNFEGKRHQRRLKKVETMIKN